MAATPTIHYPPELPVSARREDLLSAIGAHQVVVVAGETGSGKTTQLPKLCLELGRTAIAHTQPRRLAARTVAQRIADELRVPLGGLVGYAVRFNDRSSPDTQIRLMTDGLLLAEIRRDRLLRRYDTVIVDEAHERSLNVDFLLGYLKSILPRRPDLKVLITSATIDPDRFSRHFDGAPVVEVSGRTYPVQTRYRPLDGEDADVIEAIGDAVDELQREGPGDVLVFLSGEREIRDAAEALSGRLGNDTEVLPLYARLSSAEQQRIFKAHAKRRVVLATNVAETSLTVPGIRYVVDPGTARISRYSARLKVQRLPIEAISQASADQRKGRCGRTSEGICIRLYAEEDYEARPRFTDPEILRTSLASVILQMAAIGLGEIEAFPFLDPPDRRQVRDGINLLTELGALDGRRQLTAIGRRLARLPVDPRMGRMVLEAGRRGCAEEVIVIAAALSIVDPRERPSDEQAQADQQHARFADEHSDFLAYLNLWRYLRGLQAELSGSAFRRRCKAEYLHFLRVREWQDLVGQLRQAAREARVELNRVPAEPDEIHVALLAGLLSHVGLKDPKAREFGGARGTRFALWPGSALARRPPAWVMVAELVETSRLWGRTAARIRPEWVEPLAGHLLKRTYDNPRWDRKRASVVATERVTLYGLPVVAGRTVAYGRIDAATSRELFIRRALVEGEWDTRHAFVEANRALLEELDRLEQRVRRRDIVVDDQVIFDFYDARIPTDVVSGAHFDRWWRDEHRREPDRLTLTREVLVDPAAADVLDPKVWPTGWKQGGVVLRLSYVFEPGSEEDGVTAHVPLTKLGALRPEGFEWLVPGLRLELVTALIRSLPKDKRRPLVPIPDTAARVLERMPPRRGPLLEALARELGVEAGDFDPGRLPPHLRMRFTVEDEQGNPLASGHDLETVRARVRPRLRAELGAASRGLEQRGLTAWTIGTLPCEVTLPGTGVRAYPALVDEGETAGVRVLDTPAAQAAAMPLGTRRLLLLTVPSPLKWVQGRLRTRDRLALAAAGAGILDDAVTASVDALVVSGGGPAWDEASFSRLRDHVAGSLAETALGIVERAAAILDLSAELHARLDRLTAAPLQPAREDLERQARRLVHPGFLTTAGAGRLPDVERYLQGALRRLDRLPNALAADADKLRTIHELEAAWAARVAALPDPAAVPQALAEVRWMLEELRVSQFAQGLGVRGSVSAKRIRRALEEPVAA